MKIQGDGEYTALICCTIWLGIAAWSDVRHRRIPNWLTCSAAVIGTGITITQQGVATGIAFSLEGFATGFALLFLPFIMGGMGGGDVKLLAALGCWTGMRAVIEIFLYGAIIGGIASTGIIFCKTGMPGIRTVFTGIFLDMICFRKPCLPEKRLTLPYALPIFAGFATYIFL